MSTPKKVTQYMREQIAALDGEGLIEFIRKTKFTVDQRKLILRELGDIEADPRSTPAEVKTAEKATDILEEKKPLVDMVKERSGVIPELNKPSPGPHSQKERIAYIEKLEEEDKKKNRTFFEIPNFF